MAENCISLADIDHQLSCEGGNMAGIVPEIIFGYHEDVAVWPTEPVPTIDGTTQVVTPVELEAAGALVGNLTMKPGTRAFKFKFTEDAGNFSIVPVGEVDGTHFEYNLNIVKARISQTILGFMNAASQRKMFFIVPDENGEYYLMGNKRRGATFVTGGDGAVTGTTASDRNQASMQFRFRTGKALVYTGLVEELLVLVP
ncbi:MAG: hypothetical protein A2W86_11770 [Bacteroidetes bacterium GWD2_45_23]|nr:MAG: hypothetical protein A2W87_08245 [Bacteroidetes bacterium GWC2_46_850]OFX70120.1 MAG: hypothetical protein A2071_04545 [Bacteroidetes bacterium GWC1_47_7]OFX85499.1 MAG: hypothetical protein A2W86_11770 [Bacteroidetes bacterium GWD2_45_23]HBB00723.1 hypothetical protein [Porphyromonadaceae bacterium]HCC19348.1 hypothetical protein [Porphyromonadaceae bacterium]